MLLRKQEFKTYSVPKKKIRRKVKDNTATKKSGLKKQLNKEPKEKNAQSKKRPKIKLEHKKKQSKEKAQKKRKTSRKVLDFTSSSEDANYSVNDDTDESPDRYQNDNAKCLYCSGLFSEDVRGEQWIQCPFCQLWAHEECAGVEGVVFMCKFCKKKKK